MALASIVFFQEGLKELGLLQFLVKNPTLENISEVFPPDDITAYSPATVEAVIITRGNSFDFVAFDLFKQLMQDLHSGNIGKPYLPLSTTLVNLIWL